jgi:hypothetical protein
MDSRNDAKVFLTVAMWTIATVITLSGLSGQFLGNTIAEGHRVWYVLAPMITVVLTSLMMWGVPEQAWTEKTLETSQSDQKAKRQQGDKLALLLELMDDDERQAFKQLLKQQVLEETGYADGELPYADETLESLLNEDTGERSRR